MEHTTFHEWLRARMEERKLTPRPVAALIRGEGYQLSEQAVSQWWRGETAPHRKYWPALARALNVSAADLALAMAAGSMTYEEVSDG